MYKYNLFFYLILIFTVSFFRPLHAEEKMLIRLIQPDNDKIEYVRDQDFEITSYMTDDHLDVIIPVSEYQHIKNIYPGTTIITTEKDMKNNLRSKQDVTGYRTYEQTVLELQQLQSTYPEICKLYNLGKTWGTIYSDSSYSAYDEFRHNIWALKLSDNVETEEDEPCFYFFGLHHARELPSTEVVMGILYDLVNKYATDADAQKRINNSQIWFIPIVNPDGHKIVTSEVDVWWRKNIRDNNFSHTFPDSTEGVDLNRNYGFWWGDNSTSENPASYNYRGPEPWSEPENLIMKNFLQEHHFVAGISYHCYGQGVLYPHAYDFNALPDDRSALYGLGEDIGSMIRTVSGFSTYITQPINTAGANMGLLLDYAYGHHGIFSYCVEMGTEFIPPYNIVSDNILPHNLDGAYVLLDRIDFSMLTGNISDVITKSPLAAEILIDGIDGSGTYKDPYYSDTSFGRYYRFLEPGTYDVTFKAFGYTDLTINGVTISSDSITSLNVSLAPALTTPLNGTVFDSVSGSGIDSAVVSVCQNMSTITDNSGAYSFDDVPYGNYIISVSAQNYMNENIPSIIDGTTSELNFDLLQGNLEDFESSDFSRFNWSTGGSTDWFISSSDPYSGTFFARSGWVNLRDSVNSTSVLNLDLRLIEDGNISFFYKLNDYAAGDSLKFIIDNVVIDNLYGGRWTFISYPVSSGDHSFTWSYYKGSVWEYQTDHFASLDNVAFPEYIQSNIIDTDQDYKSDITLYQNYPNPFNLTTTIEFIIKEQNSVRMSLYNYKGQKVKNIFNKKLDKGLHKINFDCEFLNSGLYFVLLESGNQTLVKKIMLIK